MKKIAYVWGKKEIALSICKVHEGESQGQEIHYNAGSQEGKLDEIPSKLRKKGYQVIFSEPPEGLKPASSQCICD